MCLTDTVADIAIGINFEFAKLLLGHGCNVIIADLALRSEAQQLVDQYSSVSKEKARAIFVRTDVVKWDQLAHVLSIADSEFGGCDIICPGAGVYEPEWSNFWHPPGTVKSRDALPSDAMSAGGYALFDINLVHPTRLTQLAISHWVKAGSNASGGRKHVVHVSSIAANLPSLVAPMYAASKAAISSFVRSLAPLDQIGIRVNGVEPGVIKTPLWLDHPDKMSLIDDDQVWVEPAAVAEVMLRCCIDESVGGGCLITMRENAGKVDWETRPIPNTTVQSSAVNTARKQVFQALATPGWGVPGN